MMTVKATATSTSLLACLTVLAPITWGTTYITVTQLLPEGRPLLVATMRVVPAAVVLLVVGAVVSRWRPRGAEWWRTATLGMFNFGLFFPLLSVAVYRLPGGVAAAVGGLQPLLVVTFSWLFAQRRPRRSEMTISVVAVIGVGLVAIRPGADLDVVGLLAAVAANVSFSVGVVLTRRFPTPANRLAATGWQLLMGGTLLVPLTLIVEGAPPSLTGGNIAGFAYLSMIGTALAFIIWFNGIRRLSPVAPPLLGLAAPVTGAVLGWAVLGQSLSPLQLAGFAITIGAIAYGATVGAAHVPPLRRRRNVIAAKIVATGTPSRRQPCPQPFVSGSTRSVRGAGPRRNGFAASPTRRISTSRGSRSASS
jgi:probable blue pigment (indigoidine) exporter